MTDEQRAAQIAALTRELAAYETYDKGDRAEQVRAELRRLGAESNPRQERAVKLAKRAPRSK